MRSFQDILRLYDYALPPARIAQSPATPRDSAKLLVYDRAARRARFSTVRHLPDFLPRGAVLVLNETKVIPARLPVRKATGGAVALLFVRRSGRDLVFLANRPIAPGDVLSVTRTLSLTVIAREGSEWRMKPSFPVARISTILNRHGIAPLPPYIKHSPLSQGDIKKRYQTVFAKTPGSIAAPTASLHFTKRLLKKLQSSGVTILRVTLHVHLGTFAPLTEEQWKSGKLHPELYSIDPKTVRLLNAAKKSGRPIFAAGTTVARTLESATDARGTITKPRGETRLFIHPSTTLGMTYRFRFINGLLTNFHVPRSSLLMLVGALVGRETLLDLYRRAIAKKFRFFSFGDAMLIGDHLLDEPPR